MLFLKKTKNKTFLHVQLVHCAMHLLMCRIPVQELPQQYLSRADTKKNRIHKDVFKFSNAATTLEINKHIWGYVVNSISYHIDSKNETFKRWTGLMLCFIYKDMTSIKCLQQYVPVILQGPHIPSRQDVEGENIGVDDGLVSFRGVAKTS